MNINELGEDLEQQFGKPRNITEENVRFMLSLIKEEFDGTKVKLTNWDGTQKVGLGSIPQKKEKGLGR